MYNILCIRIAKFKSTKFGLAIHGSLSYDKHFIFCELNGPPKNKVFSVTTHRY